jgi:hypothetical protein
MLMDIRTQIQNSAARLRRHRPKSSLRVRKRVRHRIWDETDLDDSGTLAATFGATAGVFAIFFFGAVPRVKK